MIQSRRSLWLIVVLGVVVAATGTILVLSAQEEPTTAPIGVTNSPSASQPAPVSPSSAPSTPAISYAFPIVGNASYGRTHHDYPATDIFAACGKTVVAVTGGVILELSRNDMWDAATDRGDQRGGLTVSLLGDDGVRYYSAHLSTIPSSITPGLLVVAGQTIGQVGRTGKASGCHLHLGFSPPCDRVADWWIRRGVIWPWSYLDSWRQSEGQHRSPASEITAWHAANGCPAP